MTPGHKVPDLFSVFHLIIAINPADNGDISSRFKDQVDTVLDLTVMGVQGVESGRSMQP